MPRLHCLASMAILTLFLLLPSCGEPTDPDTSRVASIAIQVDSAVVEAGDSVRIPVLVVDRRGNPITSPSLTWSTSNPEIAVVTHSGVVRGARAGRTFARVEGDGIRDSVSVVVRYNLILTPSETQIVGIGRARLLEAVLLDARGPSHGATGEYAWLSRSPTIARVNQTGFTGGVIAVGLGTTWIIASEPDGAVDSARVTVLPGQLQFVDFSSPARPPLSETTVGVGQSSGGLISIGHPQAADPIVVTLQQAHPELLRLQLTEVVLSHAEGFQWTGLGTGVDTIIASATGYGPDTLIVRITRPVLRLADVPSTGYTTARSTLGLYVTDSLGQGHPILVDPPLLRLRVSSSDVAVFDVEGDSALIGANGAAEYGTVPIGIGTASLTFTDPTGRYAPVTSPAITIVPSRIQFGAEGRRDSDFEIGMEQHLRQSGAWVSVENFDRGDVRLHVESRNPRLALPDPEDPPVPGGTAFYDILAGDTTGTTWLVFTGPGLITDSMSVRVVRPTPKITGPQTAVVGETKWFGMFLGQSPDSLRFTREQVTFRITSTDTTVLVPVAETVTIPADGMTTFAGVRVVGVGTAGIRIEDVRTGYERYEDLSATITARAQP